MMKGEWSRARKGTMRPADSASDSAKRAARRDVPPVAPPRQPAQKQPRGVRRTFASQFGGLIRSRSSLGCVQGRLPPPRSPLWGCCVSWFSSAVPEPPLHRKAVSQMACGRRGGRGNAIGRLSACPNKWGISNVSLVSLCVFHQEESSRVPRGASLITYTVMRLLIPHGCILTDTGGPTATRRVRNKKKRKPPQIYM